MANVYLTRPTRAALQVGDQVMIDVQRPGRNGEKTGTVKKVTASFITVSHGGYDATYSVATGIKRGMNDMWWKDRLDHKIV